MFASGVITSSKLINLPNANLQSTHSANPLACAAGSVTIDEIKRLKLTQRAKILGKTFEKNLQNIKRKYPMCIEFVTNKGLIGAIIFKSFLGFKAKDISSWVSSKCLKKGLLVVATNRDSIKFGPPLIITKKDLNKSMKIVDECIEEFIYENSKKN